MGVAKLSASRTASSFPLVVRTSRRPWERGYVGAVLATDAVASLVAGIIAYGVRWADGRIRGVPPRPRRCGRRDRNRRHGLLGDEGADRARLRPHRSTSGDGPDTVGTLSGPQVGAPQASPRVLHERRPPGGPRANGRRTGPAGAWRHPSRDADRGVVCPRPAGLLGPDGAECAGPGWRGGRRVRARSWDRNASSRAAMHSNVPAGRPRVGATEPRSPPGPATPPCGLAAASRSCPSPGPALATATTLPPPGEGMLQRGQHHVVGLRCDRIQIAGPRWSV